MSEEARQEPEILMPDEGPPTEPAAEASKETALTLAADTSALDQLASLENAVEIIERRCNLLELIHDRAIRLTSPAHWVLNKDQAGNETAMLGKDGAALVAPLLGIKVTNIRPLDDRGNWKPRKTASKDGINFTLSGSCDARSQVTGRVVEHLRGSRSTSEKFTGRTNPELKTYAGDAVAESDLESALHTLLTVTKPVRVLGGLSRVPRAELDAAWAGTEKGSNQCQFGHGYGSGDSRRATGVAEEGVGDAANELGKEVLRRVGGSKEDAKKLLKDITSNPPKFDGFDTVARLTKGWQVKNAWEKLKAHEIFGDDAQREPGSDDGDES